MSHAHDDRSRAIGDMRAQLASLTDAHVDTLLKHGALTDGAAAVLAEAQRIAEGLTEATAARLHAMAVDVAGETEVSDSGSQYALTSKGLAVVSGRGSVPGWVWMRIEPAGRLALALRERSR